MKSYLHQRIFLILALLYGCSSQPDCNKIFVQIEKDFASGNLKKVKLLADSLKKTCPSENLLVIKADSLEQIAERIALDFSLSEEQVNSRLKTSAVNFSPTDLTAWENMNWLEYRILNGEKKYFNRAASNLNLIKTFHLNRATRDTLSARNKNAVRRRNHIEAILKASDGKPLPVMPVEMEIDYKITVKPDVVAPGEIVRCWIPYPKESHSRQQNVKFISASQDNYLISPDSAVHRTVYMEAKSAKGMPLVFGISYSYQSSGQYFDLKNLIIKPYDKSSSLYRKYTSEQIPQICFSENIKRMADSITGNETNPVEIVKKIYYWFNQNIPWAGALEYSIMPNIPEYVLKNRRGDCGMQTLLLMSMLRYKGIPARWQSGWMMPPDDKNLHDWSEVYYEGVGWVPVDVSYSLQYSENIKTKEFYISGIEFVQVDRKRWNIRKALS